MTVVILIIMVVCVFISSSYSDQKIKYQNKEKEENGTFSKMVPMSVYSRILSDVMDNWYRGDKSMFPEEYIPYLLRCIKARERYISDLVNKIIYEETEYMPFCVGTYNKYTYDPFKGFEAIWGENIKIYNETGVLYY